MPTTNAIIMAQAETLMILIIDMLKILFLLIAGHALADFPLQGDTMAVEKNRHTNGKTGVPWFYWLTAHALIHGLSVALITGRVELGIAEAFAHWLIDFSKCEKWIGIHTDQALHLVCKVLWVYLLWLSI
jgi:hypothetical protein